jgi:hypothetical protein
MFITTFCDHTTSKLDSANGIASALPWRYATLSESPVRAASIVAARQNSGVRSRPTTRQPKVLARYRDGPPMPAPTPLIALERKKPRHVPGCRPASGVELVHRREIVRREMVNVFSGRLERGKKHIAKFRPKSGATVMLDHCLRVEHTERPRLMINRTARPRGSSRPTRL